MAEFTKERLQEIAEDGFLKHGEAKAMARQLLAGLEQEPVYQACKEAGVWVDIEPGDVGSLKANGEQVREVYAAPQLPQPAVVSFDEWSRKCDLQIELCDRDFRDKAQYIWNACRAAMLQGVEPVQGWIPCSERMPEEIGRYWCYVEEQNSLGKSHYQWNCSWNGDRWWVESENGGRVTHWMPLQEPPKQTAES